MVFRHSLFKIALQATPREESGYVCVCVYTCVDHFMFLIFESCFKRGFCNFERNQAVLDVLVFLNRKCIRSREHTKPFKQEHQDPKG